MKECAGEVSANINFQVTRSGEVAAPVSGTFQIKCQKGFKECPLKQRSIVDDSLSIRVTRSDVVSVNQGIMETWIFLQIQCNQKMQSLKPVKSN